MFIEKNWKRRFQELFLTARWLFDDREEARREDTKLALDGVTEPSDHGSQRLLPTHTVQFGALREQEPGRETEHVTENVIW